MDTESPEVTDNSELVRSARSERPSVAFGAPGERPPVPAFEVIRSGLPVPVLPRFPEWMIHYWTAWERVWSGLRNPPAGSPLVGPVLVNEAGSPAQLDGSAVVARLAGYVGGDYDLIHLLDNFYLAQLDDGYIPRELDLHSGQSCFPAFDPNGTAPNLLSWTEWRHFRHTGDDTRLREVFLPSAAFHRWLRRHRTWQSGLYWTTGYASGNPAQTCVPDGAFQHGHWAWLAPTLQANLSAVLLGRMAERLEEPAAVEDITAERLVLARQINGLMWDEDTEFYYPIGPDGRFAPVRSMAAYWALPDKQLVPEDRAKLMVQALRDIHNARRKPAGPDEAEAPPPPMTTTPFSTYVAQRSLQLVGACHLAHQLAADELEDFASAGRKTAELSPVEAALHVGIILEHLLGLSIDWPLRRVTWRNYLGHEEEVGIEGVRLGDEGLVDLTAAGGVLTVRTDVGFTFSYSDREQEFQSAVPAGVTTFDLT